MNSTDKILHCYNQVAEDYAIERWDELSRKRIDQLLLKEFASVNKDKGPCADFGCGPGQTTKFLYDNGLENIVGIDLSPAMVKVAQRLSPHIKFETGDLLNIAFPSGYLGSALAFYAIVHFNHNQIRTCFTEINRVLKTGGDFLFSYHAGDEVVHFDKAHDKEIDIDLFFFKTEDIVQLLKETGFKVIDAIERRPNEEMEYPTRRAYVWAEKR
ncbi:Methyltransferase domain-containing protein [Chitinophaga terrae (ex Kim and Jung 2007)]|uniref:Methyltransferase domain-containing protein n=1 Tax=Chitinophaga terrae (ex Kim and Jung 2007) TaxID=408074 RepID=A0A1H4ETT5_9BACT|nr:class I SAM-dependent methyltransferase [Chitinophaga terrae (ex Kim and Jung 2007)]GEP91789.1 methyltransferase [Chitinophaga terrae (ex Kim and Jung 2007)]SEA87632.1 Methyltransferase domain-containing protein [Chitinophaga terrae (ex Kim and Jung 2007)]